MSKIINLNFAKSIDYVYTHMIIQNKKPESTGLKLIRFRNGFNIFFELAFYN